MYKSLQSSSFPIVFQLLSLHLCASLALVLILHPGPLTNEKVGDLSWPLRAAVSVKVSIVVVVSRRAPRCGKAFT
jgi:hypothetical protein